VVMSKNEAGIVVDVTELGARGAGCWMVFGSACAIKVQDAIKANKKTNALKGAREVFARMGHALNFYLDGNRVTKLGALERWKYYTTFVAWKQENSEIRPRFSQLHTVCNFSARNCIHLSRIVPRAPNVRRRFSLLIFLSQ
ncbi:MAG: hypothetical protein ABSG34_19190, partial [Candidatus Sulfotelmatobacter sp.]